MKKTAIVAAASLLGGFAVARWLPQSPARPEPAAAAQPAPVPSGRDAPLEARIAELERAVDEERAARQVLEEELFYLTGEIERLQAFAPRPPAAAADAAATVVAEGRRQQVASRDRSEARVRRLVASGFPEDRAEWIVQRESRFRMAMLELRHEAQRAGSGFEGYQERWNAEQDAFRRDLGEADYERYLESTGRPTAVVVGSVLDTSPAQRVGLLPGDRIVRYDNRRIYSMADLNRATLDGEAGETVYVQIERDGVSIQLTLPRGPVGVTGGGGGARQ